MKNKRLTLSTLLSIAILQMILTTNMLPIVHGVETHGHYDVNDYGTYVAASRCDHLVDPPGADPYNAFTSTGLLAVYTDEEQDAYDDVTFYYVRGFGGPIMWPHDWTCDGDPMTCRYQLNWTYSYYYDYNQPTWSYSYEWNGYYQQYDKRITPTNAYTVGARCSSYFYNYSNTNQYVYISSNIPASDLYAGMVVERDEEY